MRNTGEITRQIEELVYKQDEHEEGTEEYKAFTFQIDALKQTLVIVHNATHADKVAFINDRGSITIA